MLNKVLDANPDSVTAKIRIARILVEKGQPGKALSLAQEGLRSEPDNIALLETVGIAQLEAGRPADAVLTFTRVTELAPDSIGAFSTLARAAFLSGNASRAKEALSSPLTKLALDTSGLV